MVGQGVGRRFKVTFVRGFRERSRSPWIRQNAAIGVGQTDVIIRVLVRNLKTFRIQWGVSVSTISTLVQDTPFYLKIEQQIQGCNSYMGIR